MNNPPGRGGGAPGYPGPPVHPPRPHPPPGHGGPGRVQPPVVAPVEPPAPPKSKIECVVTCVNYSDFLAHTLPHNRGQFDRMVVVTAAEDKKTEELCEYWQVECVRTDVFRTRWGEFCKGAGINEGLKKLDCDDWLVHMDADILLPPHTRQALDLADLDKTMIYGIDRLEFKSYADFQTFYDAPEAQRQNMFVHTTHTGSLAGIATRVAFEHLFGWLPIGYYQQWNCASGRTRYPQGHTNAAREDTLFPAMWPRAKRALIPEILAYHLESENADMAVNWKKRVTKPFRFGR